MIWLRIRTIKCKNTNRHSRQVLVLNKIFGVGVRSRRMGRWANSWIHELQGQAKDQKVPSQIRKRSKTCKPSIITKGVGISWRRKCRGCGQRDIPKSAWFQDQSYSNQVGSQRRHRTIFPFDFFTSWEGYRRYYNVSNNPPSKGNPPI